VTAAGTATGEATAGTDVPDRLVPLTRLRKAVVRTVVASAAVPQFTVERTVDVRAVQRLREAGGRRFSLSDALTAATAAGLAAHRRLNASWTEEGIVEHGAVNVGLAVAVEDGLLVPAIRDADRRSLEELAAERVRLTTAAREGTLRPDDLFSTTFTISNLGPHGVSRFRALVLPPQAAILAVGAVVDGRLELALSCDHRVVDGAPAAVFLAEVADRLEDPTRLPGAPIDAPIDAPEAVT
jgi:pyruvate dehydrogenase E2 component (dihydrolipoamide acetyltransferase)